MPAKDVSVPNVAFVKVVPTPPVPPLPTVIV
jgi:hypothetical protein